MMCRPYLVGASVGASAGVSDGVSDGASAELASARLARSVGGGVRVFSGAVGGLYLHERRVGDAHEGAQLGTALADGCGQARCRPERNGYDATATMRRLCNGYATWHVDGRGAVVVDAHDLYHAAARTRKPVRAHKHIWKSHTNTNPQTNSPIHAHTNTHTRMDTNTDIRIHTHTHAHANAYTHTHTPAPAHTRTHTHTHTHTHAHTHTHTHTLHANVCGAQRRST